MLTLNGGLTCLGGQPHGRGKHGANARARGARLGDKNDEIRHFNELNENLRHVVIQRHDLTLREIAGIDLHTAAPDDGKDGEIDDDISKRVEQGRKTARKALKSGQLAVDLGKTLHAFVLAHKGTHHACAHKRLTRATEHRVKLCLHAAEHRDADKHNAKHHQTQQNDQAKENQRRLRINGEGHGDERLHCR